jgi:hypothetical protein
MALAMAALSPVVQVVTTGTDWPAIVAAISTGVVGIAGIVATFLSGKRRINAENERARLAEKRRIYAAFMAAVDSLYVITIHADDDNTQLDSARYNDARTALYRATSELRLVAPPDVEHIVWEIGKAIDSYASSRRKGKSVSFPDNFGSKRSDLERAMRADLAETD